MTVMLRAEGIPARYVTGFLPGEYNDVGGDYIMRESDAHTWVEVFFPGYGWMTFDPTPAARMRSAAVFSSASALYWDWFQFAWSEWVVNYDFTHQLTLRQRICTTHRATWASALARTTIAKQQQAMRVAGARSQNRSVAVFSAVDSR